MPYAATQEQLIEDCQNYLETDPRFFLEDEGAFTWWGKVVLFKRNDDEVTLDVDGDHITFPRFA